MQNHILIPLKYSSVDANCCKDIICFLLEKAFDPPTLEEQLNILWEHALMSRSDAELKLKMEIILNYILTREPTSLSLEMIFKFYRISKSEET